jgi:hypothetical protein
LLDVAILKSFSSSFLTSSTCPPRQVNINKAKKDKFKILRPDLDAIPEDDPFFDPALRVDRKKILRPRRAAFQFVEEGKWSQQAEAQRLRVRTPPCAPVFLSF